MNSHGRVHHLIASLNPNYAVRRCVWAGIPGFQEADAEVYAFIVGSMLKFTPRTLQLISQQMSPLAIGVLFWGAAELKRACGFSLRLDRDEWPSASVCLELARYAEDGCPLVDDNR
jgi:hypothetical protein